MASPFDVAVAAAAATHDAIMAEAFDYRPFAAAADVNAVAQSDPGRAVVSGLLATWGDSAARVHGDAFREPGVKSERPGHASSRPFVSLDLARLPYQPRVGDRIVRLKTGGIYRVAEVLPSSPGFVRLDLNAVT